MSKTIKLRVRKEINRDNELKVLKLKGTLITKKYTEIIHIEDENEDFYLNTFSVSSSLVKDAENQITTFISTNNLSDIVTLLKV